MPPFPVVNNDLGMYNWTQGWQEEGGRARPYGVAVKYYCPREEWGYPSNGLREQIVHCNSDGQWSNEANVENCQSK